MPKPFEYYLGDEFQKATLERHGFAAIRCFIKKENPVHALVGLTPFKIADQYYLAEELRFILYSTDENAILSRFSAITAALNVLYANGKPSAHLNSDTTGLSILAHALVCRFSGQAGSQASSVQASLKAIADTLSKNQRNNQVLSGIFTPTMTILNTPFSKDTSPVFKLDSHLSDKSTQTIDGENEVGKKDASSKSSESRPGDGSEEVQILQKAIAAIDRSAQKISEEEWKKLQGTIDSFIQSHKNRLNRTFEDAFFSALFQVANKLYEIPEVDRAFWVIQKISELFQQSGFSAYNFSEGMQLLQIIPENLEEASDAHSVFVLQTLIQLLQPMTYRHRFNNKSSIDYVLEYLRDTLFRQYLEKIITTFEPKSSASAAALSNLFEILFQSFDLHTLLLKRNTTLHQKNIQTTSTLLRRWYQVTGFFGVLFGGGVIGTGTSLLLLFVFSTTLFNPLTLLFIAAPIAAVGLIGLVSAWIWNSATGFVHKQKETLEQQENQFPKPLPIYPLDQNIYVLTTLKDWFETYDISVKSHRDLIAAFMRYPVLINEIQTKRDFAIFSVCFENFDNSTELSYMLDASKTAELFLLQTDEVFEKSLKGITVKKLFEESWMRFESEIKKKVLDKIISNPKFFTALITTTRDLVDVLNQLDADKKAPFIEAIMNEKNGVYLKKLLKDTIDLEELWGSLKNSEQAKILLKNRIASDKNFFEDAFFSHRYSNFQHPSSEVINILFDWTIGKPNLLTSLIRRPSDLYKLLNNINDDKKLYVINVITSVEQRACFSGCIMDVEHLDALLGFVSNNQKDSVRNAIWATIDSDDALFVRLLMARATDLSYPSARLDARVQVSRELSPKLLKTLPKHEDQIIEKLFRSEFKRYRDFLFSIEFHIFQQACDKFSPKAHFSEKNLPFVETVMQLIDLKHYMCQNKAKQQAKVIEDLNMGWKRVDSAQRSLLVKVIDDIFPNTSKKEIQSLRTELLSSKEQLSHSTPQSISTPTVTPSVYAQPEQSIATASKPDSVKSEKLPENEKKPSM